VGPIGQLNPKKSDIVAKILESISTELESMERSARAAHEAATHEESRSEDSHDTRSIEAGYLAGAQAVRVAELKKLLILYREMDLRAFQKNEPIAVGALVHAKLDEKPAWYFLVNAGAAGMAVDLGIGIRVQVVTARSPLGQALIGQRPGDIAEVESQKGSTEVEILSVA
jgi:transcription elongation GreA/GreB family factor